MQREFITPEQDPEAVVGEWAHRLRTAVNDGLKLASDPVTREQVLREADIEEIYRELGNLVSFRRSRLPMEAAE